MDEIGSCHICSKNLCNCSDGTSCSFCIFPDALEEASYLFCVTCNEFYKVLFHYRCVSNINFVHEDYPDDIYLACNNCSLCTNDENRIKVTETDIYFYVIDKYLDKSEKALNEEIKIYMYYGEIIEKILNHQEITRIETQRIKRVCEKILEDNNMICEDVIKIIKNQKYLKKINNGKLTKCAIKK